MTAREIMNDLFRMAQDVDYSNTCDTCKAGNPDREVEKIAISMFATPEIVRKASEWGAELLIVHEPTYYDHFDGHTDDKIENEKRKLIEDCGIVLYRYHDHMHFTIPDMILKGQLKKFGLEGEVEYFDLKDHARITLNTPLTSIELAKIIEDRCGIKHMRICGTTDKKCTNISVMPGTPAGVFEELKRDETQILLTGEAIEWMLGEYARDASQLGYTKTLIIMGHIGSERDGMIDLADILKNKYPSVDVKYFECGEVYSYTDSNL